MPSTFVRNILRRFSTSRTAMAGTNRVKNVAIVGAGGNVGQWIAEALVRAGNHTVTAVTREGSPTQLPDGIHHVKKVDYGQPSTIVDALKGQDALVITLGAFAPPETQPKLVEAAVEAGVPFVLPNEWSPDTANEGLTKDVFAFSSKPPIRQKIADLGQGKTSYIAVSTGFWYEWSLAVPAAYGFDFAQKKVVFFDDGETVFNTSTWPQVGRAVAALLSLPVEPEGGKTERCLSRFKNQQVYVSSFTITQKDIFNSVLRVTKTKPEDWEITHEGAQERYLGGVKAMKEGDRMGFAKMMYTRVFYKDDSGNFEKTRGTLNTLLGLPREDIDEATQVAIKRAQETKWSG